MERRLSNDTPVAERLNFEAFAEKFDFDILDPTKIIPEELVPITPLGKLLGGLIAFLVGLGLTSGSLWVLHCP